MHPCLYVINRPAPGRETWGDTVSRTILSALVGAGILACMFIGFSGHSRPGNAPSAVAPDAPIYQPIKTELVDVSLSAPVDAVAKAVHGPGGEVTSGAVLCDSYDKTLAVYDMYETHYSEEFQKRMTGGRSVLIQGAPATAPDPDSFGCVLVPAGTPMKWDQTAHVPLVEAHFANGDTVKGITLIPMIGKE